MSTSMRTTNVNISRNDTMTSPYNSVALNATVSALELLSEESRQKVLHFTIGLLKEQKKTPYKLMSEKDFLDSIDISLDQADKGQKKDAFMSLDDITARLENKR